ncbi:MAG: hypothetical protein RIT45_3515 [Pseudomonadota bacterium]
MAHVGGRAGVLLLHGFTGSPWELRPLAESLRAEGYTVAMPLLPGHGTRLEDLDRTGWQDWLAGARSALDWMTPHVDRVHLCGSSMGALLTLLLAQQQLDRPLRSVTLLAPAMALSPPIAAAIRVLALAGRPAFLRKEPVPLADGASPPAYDGIPVRATRRLLELMDVVNVTARPLEVPALALHGTADATIPYARARALVAPLLGRGGLFVPIPDGGHLLLRVEQAPLVLARLESVRGIIEAYGPDAPGAIPRRRSAA